MTPKKVREFFGRLAAANPDPKGELEYATPFQLLVAVVLSASRLRNRAIGSRSFQTSTSAETRYFVGSSEVVCAPIR